MSALPRKGGFGVSHREAVVGLSSQPGTLLGATWPRVRVPTRDVLSRTRKAKLRAVSPSPLNCPGPYQESVQHAINRRLH